MHDDIWWMNPGHTVRSSPAMEREVVEWMAATGQDVECALTHGLALNPGHCQSLLRKGRCPACKAAL